MGTRARGPVPRAGLCTAPSGTAQQRGLHAALWGRSPKERKSRGRWCCAHAGCSSAQRRSELCSRARCTHTSVPRAHPSLSGAHPRTHAHPRNGARYRGPTHAEGSFPPAPPAPLALPGQQREVHLQPSAPKPAGRDCCGPAPFPSPGLRSRTPALRSPAWLTVKMLERRLDCLRMGVGVLEAAMVSIRSSRWLMLGVEGTEEE